MYRFQICAATQPGETIALVGSIPEMGSWDVAHCVPLQTRGDRYPLWWVDLELHGELNGTGAENWGDRSPGYSAEFRAEYKYVRIRPNGSVEWEAWGSNRWVPIETDPLPSPVIVDDGVFGSIPPYPYGYFAEPVVQPRLAKSPEALKIAVIGSSVALGCSAWLLRGWAWQLGQALQHQYGHQLVNLSEVGANISRTIARFAQVVAPEQPDIVIIALSLGNEGLASSPAHQHRAIQRHFENGLQQLIKMTLALGARPILGGVYPNENYQAAHYSLLQETRQRMLNWGVPVLDWLEALDNGKGRWKPGLSFDAAHPNTLGHQRMFEAIRSQFSDGTNEFALFNLTQADLAAAQLSRPEEISLYRDGWGFEISVYPLDNGLRIRNTTAYGYTIAPHWQTVQTAIQQAKLPSEVYLAEDPTIGAVSLVIQEDGTIATSLQIPASADLKFYPASHFSALPNAQTLFCGEDLTILKMGDRRLYVINQSEHEYNLHPMWKEVRAALKAMPAGVYEDLAHPEIPFRTLMIGSEGLESRVKSPAQSAIVLDYRCALSEVSRIAILPLGDRCAVRMLLYKLEYDGPAFPFDLTRTTNLADVADIIQNDFSNMWNPAFLQYNHDARRIYHTLWTGLSFAHEVEDSDDPVHDLFPVYERMRTRYTARSNRFRYTLQNCDKVLFVRTGLCDRGAVVDLVQKLEAKGQGKPFRLLLISPQDSDEFANLPNVLHYNLEFNPDRMYEDLGYWLHCTDTMRGILNSLGISSKNLFWCPPTVKPAAI